MMARGPLAALLLLLAASSCAAARDRSLRSAPTVSVARTYFLQAEFIWFNNACGEYPEPPMGVQPDGTDLTDDPPWMPEREFGPDGQPTGNYKPGCANYADQCRDGPDGAADILKFVQIYTGGPVETGNGGLDPPFIGGVGSTSIYAVYRQYSDDSFARSKRFVRKEDENYLGTLGPILHCVEGETIEIVFKNSLQLNRSTNLPAGQTPYGKDYPRYVSLDPTLENVSLDPDTGIDVLDVKDGVHVPFGTQAKPGETVRMYWRCNGIDTKGPRGFFYRSNTKTPMMTRYQNAGMYGVIAVEEPPVTLEERTAYDIQGKPIVVDGAVRTILTPSDVAHEVASIVYVQKADQSITFDINCLSVSKFRPGQKDKYGWEAYYDLNPANTDPANMIYPSGDLASTPNWGGPDEIAPACQTPLDPEPMTHHTINGYWYCWLPDIILFQNSKARWLVSVLGDQGDTHPWHFHGNTLVLEGERVDAWALSPSNLKVLDMPIDNSRGNWLMHCHINDHIGAGMIAWYHVINNPINPVPEDPNAIPGEPDTYTLPPLLAGWTGPQDSDILATEDPVILEALLAKRTENLAKDYYGVPAMPAGQGAQLREYWVKTRAVWWDYSNQGAGYVAYPFGTTPTEDPYFGTCPNTIQYHCKMRAPGETDPEGCGYWKAQYQEWFIPDEEFCKAYNIANAGNPAARPCTCWEKKWECALPKPRHREEAHMGILGPTFKAEVGDIIRVHLKNDPFPQCTLGSFECLPKEDCSATCNVKFPQLVIEGVTVGPGNLVIGTNPGSWAAAEREFTHLAFSMHPHGVWYNKKNEGAPYYTTDANDLHMDDYVPNAMMLYNNWDTSIAQEGLLSPAWGLRWWASLTDAQKADPAIARYNPAIFTPSSPADVPQMATEYTYNWMVEGRSGPGDQEGPCVAWPGHSHSDEVMDSYAGLEFFILVCRRDKSNLAVPALIDAPITPPAPRAAPIPGTNPPAIDEKTVYTDQLGLWYRRTIVHPTIATREIYMVWMDDQEQESAMCMLNTFATLQATWGLTVKARCDATFLASRPMINAYEHCIPEFYVDSSDTVLMGWYGLGSEADINSVHWSGIPMMRSDHTLLGNGLALLPGTSRTTWFNASLVPYSWMSIHSQLGDYWVRGQNATLTITNPKPLVETPTKKRRFFLQAKTVVWDFYPTTKGYTTDASGNVVPPPYTDALGTPLVNDQLDTILASEVSIGTKYAKAMYSVWEYPSDCQDDDTDRLEDHVRTTKPVSQIGLTGPMLKAHPGEELVVTLCNIDVPFDVTFHFACPIQPLKTLIHVEDGTTVVKTHEDDDEQVYVESQFKHAKKYKEDEYFTGNLTKTSCATYYYYIPKWYDPQYQVHGLNKDSMSCIYHSLPKGTPTFSTVVAGAAPPPSPGMPPSAPPPSPEFANGPFPDVGESFYDLPNPMSHMTAGLSGVLVIENDNSKFYSYEIAGEFPIQMHVYDENRAPRELIAMTRELHGAPVPGRASTGLWAGARPYNAPELLRWQNDSSMRKASEINSFLFHVPDPQQYLFEQTPNHYYHYVECQAQSPEVPPCPLAQTDSTNDTCACRLRNDCQIPIGVEPTDPAHYPTDGALYSCPVCDYLTNFENPEGCEPFSYLYANWKYSLNSYIHGSNPNKITLQAGKHYRFHVYTPGGDYYPYYLSLQVMDVQVFAIKGLPTGSVSRTDQSYVLTNITEEANKVAWPTQAHTIDVYVPFDFSGQVVMMSENEYQAKLGMLDVINVQPAPSPPPPPSPKPPSKPPPSPKPSPPPKPPPRKPPSPKPPPPSPKPPPPSPKPPRPPPKPKSKRSLRSSAKL